MNPSKKSIVTLTIWLLLCFLVTSAGHQNKIPRSKTAGSLNPNTLQDTSWTKAKAAKWFNSKTWLNGLKLKPHPSIDQLEFAKQYAGNKSRWDKAFAYLKATDLATIKAGHYQIEGEDVYANVTEAPSKDFDKTQYEAHQQYTDIHMMISGKEKIGVAQVSAATVKTPYDNTKDIGFYNVEGKIYVADPNTFFIFFPGNAHRPGIKVDGENVVRKIVIKIKSAGK